MPDYDPVPKVTSNRMKRADARIVVGNALQDLREVNRAAVAAMSRGDWPEVLRQAERIQVLGFRAAEKVWHLWETESEGLPRFGKANGLVHAIGPDGKPRCPVSYRSPTKLRASSPWAGPPCRHKACLDRIQKVKDAIRDSIGGGMP